MFRGYFFLFILFPFLIFTLAPSAQIPRAFFYECTHVAEPYAYTEPDGQYISVPLSWRKDRFIYGFVQIHENLHCVYFRSSAEYIGIRTLIETHYHRGRLISLLGSLGDETEYDYLMRLFKDSFLMYWVIQALWNPYFYSQLFLSLKNSPDFNCFLQYDASASESSYCFFHCLQSLRYLIPTLGISRSLGVSFCALSCVQSFATFLSVGSVLLFNGQGFGFALYRRFYTTLCIDLRKKKEVPKRFLVTREWVDALKVCRKNKRFVQLIESSSDLVVGNAEITFWNEGMLKILAPFRGNGLGHLLVSKHFFTKILYQGFVSISDETSGLSGDYRIGERLYLNADLREIFIVLRADPGEYYYYLRPFGIYRDYLFEIYRNRLLRLEQKLERACHEVSESDIRAYIATKGIKELIQDIIQQWEYIPVMSQQQLQIRDTLMNASQDNCARELLALDCAYNRLQETVAISA